MIGKELRVRELQAQGAGASAEPQRSGMLVRIEKPVPVSASDRAQAAAHVVVEAG